MSNGRNLSIVLLEVGLAAETFRFLYQNLKIKPDKAEIYIRNRGLWQTTEKTLHFLYHPVISALLVLLLPELLPQNIVNPRCLLSATYN